MVRNMDDEAIYRILTLLDKSPQITQRELAKTLGISLGKTNSFIKALVSLGFVKVSNYVSYNKKITCAYYLTNEGISEKANVTRRYLDDKISQYSALKLEIDLISLEIK